MPLHRYHLSMVLHLKTTVASGWLDFVWKHVLLSIDVFIWVVCSLSLCRLSLVFCETILFCSSWWIRLSEAIPVAIQLLKVFLLLSFDLRDESKARRLYLRSKTISRRFLTWLGQFLSLPQNALDLSFHFIWDDLVASNVSHNFSAFFLDNSVVHVLLKNV